MPLNPYHRTAFCKQGVFIAYGANLPWGQYSALQALAHVVKRLQDKKVTVETISSLWRSAAWPDPTDPPYVNAVLKVSTTKTPDQLLAYLHEMEAEAGRVRNTSDHNRVNTVRNAARTLDLDLIAYHDEVRPEGRGAEGAVVLPHPRAHERGFVMGPLAEIAPDWVHPVLKHTAADLYTQITVGLDAHVFESTEAITVSGA